MLRQSITKGSRVFPLALCTAAFLLAGCGGGGSSPTSLLPSQPATAPIQPLKVTVIGDSISKLQVLPDSPVPCGWPTSTTCGYSTDGSKAYPAVVGQLTGDTIINLAQPGAFTVGDRTVNGTVIPATLTMVPQVPSDSDIVVIESGTNDISAHGLSDALLGEVDQVVAAVRKQAPQARLVFVGVRYFNGCEPPLDAQTACRTTTVDAWDAHEQGIANTLGGTFVDIRSQWAPQVNADWPDGTHPGPNAVQTIAQLVANAIR